MKLRSLGYAALAVCTSLLAATASADERFFTYNYTADVLPAGAVELEQRFTNQSGRQHGEYTEWNLRSEVEYGLTEKLMTALYLNLDDVRASSEGGGIDNSFHFGGISSEWIYQISNPNLDPVGFAVYGELTSDGQNHEVEGKLLLSSNIDDWTLVANAAYEAEFAREEGRTAKEAELTFTGGASYHLSPSWAVGVEARNVSDYPDGLNVRGQEFQAWSIGPNLHYSNPRWWTTLTVLPQIWGNGDGAGGGRNLEHEEKLEVRLIAGVIF